MAFLPGKFARFRVASAAITGPFRWNVGFRRERLDTTNFESATGVSGVNVHSEGLTGPLDTIFNVEGVLDSAGLNIFFPESALTCDLYFRKSVALGYAGVVADVLTFNPSTAVRDRGAFTAELQASGLVPQAA